MMCIAEVLQYQHLELADRHVEKLGTCCRCLIIGSTMISDVLHGVKLHQYRVHHQIRESLASGQSAKSSSDNHHDKAVGAEQRVQRRQGTPAASTSKSRQPSSKTHSTRRRSQLASLFDLGPL